MGEKEESHADSLRLVGGWLCLDFANTVSWRGTSQPHESLNTYSELIKWSQHAGILQDGRAHQLLREAKLHPRDANAALKRAIILREAIYRIFSAIADGLPPKAGDLNTLNTELSAAMARLQITTTSSGFTMISDANESELHQMLWPVARSAADLLTSKKTGGVRKCSAKDCGWLFLDMSRNRTRRWCDMKDCGNRAKARRYYERKRVLT